MPTKTTLLLNSQQLNSATPINLTEWVDYSWARELTFIVDIQQVLGGPTAGTVTGKFQKRLAHKTGAIQYASQRLVDLAPEEAASWLTEGDWPTPLAAYNMAGPLTYQRTVTRFGSGINLALTVNGLTGGTAPSFQVSALVIAKG